MCSLASTERQRALANVKRDGFSFLRDVPERYRADREIVLEAVKKNGRALAFAAKECKSDREIVLGAVQQDGHALECAAEECKADSAIVLAAVQQNGHALEKAAEECKTPPDPLKPPQRKIGEKWNLFFAHSFPVWGFGGSMCSRGVQGRQRNCPRS
eukprot:2384464-Amphidinium_carterae.1